MKFRRNFENCRGASLQTSFAAGNRAALEATAVTEISTYEQLRAALNRRRIELGLSMTDLDARAGWPDGYTGKVLSNPNSIHSCYRRNLGPSSMDLVLGALRVKLAIIPIACGRGRRHAYHNIQGIRGGCLPKCSHIGKQRGSCLTYARHFCTKKGVLDQNTRF